jgi:2-oxo-3-hexenedioate decarboxylase
LVDGGEFEDRVLSIESIADELAAAYANRQMLPAPLSAREPGFDLAAAYAVEAELTRRRRASGHTTVGRKVGYANKAVWRALKLDTLVWAHMYDDTVVETGAHAPDSASSLSLRRMCSPRIEPEIVFKLKHAPDPAASDPAAILRAVEWLALGFEIVDSVFVDWKFQPADFVAAFGLHAALVVAEPRPIQHDQIPALVDQLAQFRVRLMRTGEVVAEGGGRNSLRSPALCLGELASAIARRPGQEPLLGGELVSSGTLTDPQPIAPGETWTATADGIELPSVTLVTVP